MKTRRVEYIVSVENLLSVEVEAPVGEDGEVDWAEADKLLDEKAPAEARDFFFRMAGEDYQILVQESHEVAE